MYRPTAPKSLYSICSVLFSCLCGPGLCTDYNDLSDYYGFGPMKIIKLDWAIHSLQIADLNRDGRNDIIVANNRKARIELLIQKENISDAQPPLRLDPDDVDVNRITPPSRFDHQSIPVSQKIIGLVCGDLNGDNLPDIAFHGEPRGLYIILQKHSDSPGTLTWHTRKKITITDALSAPAALACADLNHDGRLDLALASSDGVYLIIQQPDGSLAEPLKYPTNAQLLNLKLTDLNGDGLKDLVLLTADTDRPLYVRFALSSGKLGPEEPLFIERPFVFHTADIDDDPGDEILTVDARSGRLSCYKLTTAGSGLDNWLTLFYPLPSGPDQTKRDLVLADFDGDGLSDLIISDPGSAQLFFYRQLPAIGLAEPVRFPAYADITNLAAADLDGDGKAELAVLSVKEKVIGLSHYQNDRFIFPAALELRGDPLAATLADLDDNGATDCVYIAKDPNKTRYLRVIYDLPSLAESEPNYNSTTVLQLAKLTANPEGLIVFDADHDGLKDLLVFVPYELPLFIRQYPAGRFALVDAAKTQASLLKNAAPNTIAIADIDGKTGRKLLIAQQNFARSLVFSAAGRWRVLDQYNAKSTENKIASVAAFRLSLPAGDQPTIALLDAQKGRLQLLTAEDGKSYHYYTELNVGKWYTAPHLKILLAALTGRPHDDCIVLFDSKKFALLIPPGPDNTTHKLEQQFTYETKITRGAYGNITTGDINSDQRIDIIMVEHKRNYMEILALDPTYRPVPAMRFKIFEQKSYRQSETEPKISVEPRELKVADVTGDGKNDLVAVIHDRIIIYPQD